MPRPAKINMKLDAVVAALPVGHLQLEGHARKATAGLLNIGQLVRMFRRRFGHIRGSGGLEATSGGRSRRRLPKRGIIVAAP